MNIKYDLSELEQRPPIFLKIQGHLRVHGWDQPTLEAQTPDEDPTLNMDQTQILIETEHDLTINLPADSQLKLQVEGDATIHRMEAEVQIIQVGGDLSVEASGVVEAKEVGGNLHVRTVDSFTGQRVSGDASIEAAQMLVLDRVGGDLSMRQIEDELHLSAVGGNLRVETAKKLSIDRVGGDLFVVDANSLNCRKVGGNATTERVQSVELDHVGGDIRVRHAHRVSTRKVGGNVEAVDVTNAVAVSASGDLRLLNCGGDIAGNAGGDAKLEITSAAPKVRVNARGNIHCIMGEESSGNVRVICGGELHVTGKDSNLAVQGRGVHTFQVGSGDGTISMIAGGDVQVNCNTNVSEIRSVTGDFTEVQQEMKELNVELGHLNQELERMGIELGREFGSLGEKIAEKINRKLRQKFERHSRKAEARAGKGWAFSFGSPMPPVPPVPPVPPRAPYPEASRSEPVSEEERMLVLRMVEEGKITASEAEKLLAALEGEYPES
ncbi:MAG: hypothetical protein KF893_04290 [Caldilineaceae bacterium]|nr:hypothetical protein [Caldilineaceae bacterium]